VARSWRTGWPPVGLRCHRVQRRRHTRLPFGGKRLRPNHRAQAGLEDRRARGSRLAAGALAVTDSMVAQILWLTLDASADGVLQQIGGGGNAGGGVDHAGADLGGSGGVLRREDAPRPAILEWWPRSAGQNQPSTASPEPPRPADRRCSSCDPRRHFRTRRQRHGQRSNEWARCPPHSAARPGKQSSSYA
jgi:hypothetical protein